MNTARYTTAEYRAQSHGWHTLRCAHIDLWRERKSTRKIWHGIADENRVHYTIVSGHSSQYKARCRFLGKVEYFPLESLCGWNCLSRNQTHHQHRGVLNKRNQTGSNMIHVTGFMSHESRPYSIGALMVSSESFSWFLQDLIHLVMIRHDETLAISNSSTIKGHHDGAQWQLLSKSSSLASSIPRD